MVALWNKAVLIASPIILAFLQHSNAEVVAGYKPHYQVTDHVS